MNTLPPEGTFGGRECNSVTVKVTAKRKMYFEAVGED
jgi:hypothetical protein